MQISNIKPLRGGKYELVVVDANIGSFKLVRLSDGQQSPTYTNYTLVIYGCFKDCLDDGEKFFDGLCDEESKSW